MKSKYDYFGWPEFVLESPNFFWADERGPRELIDVCDDEDYERYLKKEEELLERALEFVIYDLESPFYADSGDDCDSTNHEFTKLAGASFARLM